MPLAVNGTLSSPLHPGRANHGFLEVCSLRNPIDPAESYPMRHGPVNWKSEPRQRLEIRPARASAPTAPRAFFRGHSRLSSSSSAGCTPHSPRALRAATAPDKNVPDPLPPAREEPPRLAIGLQPGP